MRRNDPYGPRGQAESVTWPEDSTVLPELRPREPYFEDAHPRRQRHWGRRALALLLSPILVVAAFLGYLDLRLHRDDVFANVTRPAPTRGTNWLIVGSDSRAGLSRQEQNRLHTGRDAGKRTDSMMLLHVGAHGSTLVSLPRDSYLPIPGHPANKLNAAFSTGGPKLLTRTIEKSSGLRIDHYAEIGFGGFVGMVDEVGGVRMCIQRDVHDKKAGLDLRAGCQLLDGRRALAYVRSRHAYAGGDLDRVRHQREFLSALVHKVTSHAVVTDPFRLVPLAQQASSALTIAHGDHLWDLAKFAQELRGITQGDGVTTTVPIKGGGTKPGIGEYVTWNAPRAAALFTALREDRPVPKSEVKR